MRRAAPTPRQDRFGMRRRHQDGRSRKSSDACQNLVDERLPLADALGKPFHRLQHPVRVRVRRPLCFCRTFEFSALARPLLQDAASTGSRCGSMNVPAATKMSIICIWIPRLKAFDAIDATHLNAGTHVGACEIVLGFVCSHLANLNEHA